MLFKSKAFCYIILHLCVFTVISAGDLEITKTPSNGKINPVHHRLIDERKISKRHNEPDFQTCLDNFEIHQDKIIRTQDSRAMGARYINERDVPSREDCLRLCCETSDCDVFVFEERSPGSCYLFQCGTPEEFKCKFTKHRNYTSAVLAMNRHMTELESQIKLTKHEHELTNLRQTDSSPTAIVSVSNTESTLLPDNKETEQLIPTSLNNNSANNNRRCSRYQFECRSSEECIAIYNACDGIPQCSDGSDEAPELGCPALLTTITPAERVSQGEIPENMGMQKAMSDSSLHSIPTQEKHQHSHQSAPASSELQSHHGSKEYNPDAWMQQSGGYRSNEQPQLQQHHRHQEMQLEQQNEQLRQQQQLQEHEQHTQLQQQRLRQQALQQQQQLLQESQQQKLQQPQEHQQMQQTQLQQQVSSGGNYIQNNNGIRPQEMLTMSSILPQQHPQFQQFQTQQNLQQQQQHTQQLDSIQPPQQLINQAKLYGREGEGLLYHSPPAADSLHWPSNSNNNNNNNNYQQEQTQENLSYHLPNSGMSQIFNHKGNGLVSQSERYRLQNHMYLSKAIAMEGGAGNQFADAMPNEYSRYNNYFDNSQYRGLPHAQQNTWQNVHKHELNALDDSIGEPHEGESAVPSGLNGIPPDYYYEESMRNKLQQQLLTQQRLMAQNNMPLPNGEQLLPGRFKDLKSPAHEEITLDHVNHESASTGQGTSVKKSSANHPSSVVITTEKPKESKTHHYGHNSHRKMEQLTAEVTLRETNFDGVTMQQAGSPSGAILSLTLGMCVTAVMIVLVGCRMRTVRRRMRRGGKSAYAHDADFLVNGMYL